MFKNKLFIGLLAAGLFIVAGCEKEQTPDKKGVFLYTSTIDNIALVSGSNKVTATAQSDVDIVGVGPITERGVVWGADAKPTTANNKSTAGTGTGHYSANITDLDYAANYHIRAYVISDGVTYYGNDVAFQALLAPVEIIKNGDFKLPDDGVKHEDINTIPDWNSEEDPYYHGREYDPYRNSGCVYLNDFGNFYQAIDGEIPGVKSNYKIKFDANYVWTNWGPYAPKVYVTFSTFTDDPANRTPIGSVEIATIVEWPADANVNWKSYEANFSIPAASPSAGKKLVIEWSLENYKTESWGWSETWYDFDNISVMRSLE